MYYSIPKQISFRIDQKWQMIIHCLGLSSLGGALFLQSVVFTSILAHGYFQGIEQNSSILFSEIALTVFAVAYFVYLYANFIISNR